MSDFLRRGFYCSMSLLIAAIVAIGFAQTAKAHLIHPPFRLPTLLYAHAVLSTLWILLFVIQTSLVYARRIDWHRRVGTCALVVGCAIPVVGVATDVMMTRLDVQHGITIMRAFLIAELYYTAAFGVAFAFAALWRKRPELHRRLMFIATCILTIAAFTRLPGIRLAWGDACVDGMIFLGVVRDWVVTRRLHPVYRYALPMLIVGQSIVTYAYVTRAQWWLAIANKLLGSLGFADLPDLF